MNGAIRVMQLSGRLYNGQFDIIHGIDIPREENQLICVRDMAYIRPWNTHKEAAKLLWIYEIMFMKESSC